MMPNVKLFWSNSKYKSTFQGHTSFEAPCTFVDTHLMSRSEDSLLLLVLIPGTGIGLRFLPRFTLSSWRASVILGNLHLVWERSNDVGQHTY